MRRTLSWVMCVATVVGVAACSSGAPITSGAINSRDASVVAIKGALPAPNRTLISYGGQFLSSCPLTHQGMNDPIMHRNMPGMSHMHEFFGNVSTDAYSTYASMIDKDTTCSDDGDRSGYWVPALDIDGVQVVPRRVDAYYRVAQGVNPKDVRPYPNGLEVLAGDQHATSWPSLLVAAWTCGLSPDLSHTPPKDCTPDRPLQLRLTYPSCWDGTHISTANHTSNLAYPNPHSGCDAKHPVAVPQLTLTVHYAFAGTYKSAKLASGGFTTTHGDFLAAWQHPRIDDQVSGCLQRGVTCGIVGGTFHTGQGSRDIDSYNQH